MRIFLSIIGLLFLLNSCTKETQDTIENEVNPTISNTPKIELLEVNQQSVVAYEDQLIFTIEYLDGDGDLGSLDPDKMNIELVDQRDPALLIFGYHLSPRAPEGSEISIQGTLDIILDNTILLDSDNSTENTTFKIRILDEAGNWSNEVESPVITISK
ncbi:MAG: hypothetical protein KDC34_00550 [Saprospiraceae bacterium]|nr:hypothetical protein [Saprospiraceae bacterium]